MAALVPCKSSVFCPRASKGAPAVFRPSSQRQRTVQVFAGKGKGKSMYRQQAGFAQNQQPMQRQGVQVPEVDPENVEFVIFYKTEKVVGAGGVPLPSTWQTLSIVRAGQQANFLVKAMESKWGQLLYGKTLVRNIAAAVYKDRLEIIRQLKSAPNSPYKTIPAKDFQFAFKVREKSNPADWKKVENLTVLPAEEDIQTPQEVIGNFFSSASLSKLFAQ